MKNTLIAIRDSRNGVRLLMLVAMLSLCAGVTLRSAASTPAAAVNLVNNSGLEIRALYLSPAGNDNWGPDQLNGAVISPGGTYTLSYSWNEPTVKIVAEDSDGCFLTTTVDAAGNSAWTITSNSQRNCG